MAKTLTRKQLIIALVLTLLLILCIYIYKPLEKARINLYNKYEEYRVEVAKQKAERNISKRNIISKAYNGKYPPPINGTITSTYGSRTINGRYDRHTGIDISGIHRDNVTSITDGVVTFSGSQNGFGYCVEIRHDTPNDGTFYTFYAHLSSINVSKWQEVKQGEVIGKEGGGKGDPNPGYSTGHHLHFEVRTASGYGNDINPYSYIF